MSPKPPVDRYRAVHARSPSSRCAPQYHASASSAGLPGAPKPYDATALQTAQRRGSRGLMSGNGHSSINTITIVHNTFDQKKLQECSLRGIMHFCKKA